MPKGVFSLVILALVAGSAARLMAQDAPEPSSAVEPARVTNDQTSPAAPTPSARHVTDVGDLWRHARHRTAPAEPRSAAETAKRPFFFVSPSISSKPSTGFSVGLASSVVFVAGDPAVTHISSADWSVSDSVKGQAGTSLRFRIYTPGNQWFLQGDNRLAWSNQNTYELGIVPDATAQKLKFNRRRVYETLFRQVKPRVLVGFGLNVNVHTNVRAASGTPASFEQSAYVNYSVANGLAIDREVSSGTVIGIVADTRDNSINASRGWFASANYRTFFKNFLGGSSTWQLLDADARTYRALGRSGRQKIAFWTYGEFVTGGTAPYLDLPAIADDMYGRSGRGYTTARYRGPRLLYGEAEYRATLTANGLIGAVVFANATAIDGGAPDQGLFATVAPAAGVGVRILLSKRSRSNMGVDYGWGAHGSRGLYIAVRETF